MVAADRRSGDCEPEVLADPSAGDGSGWDDAAVEEIAESIGAAHLVRGGARRDEVLDAYAVAWREAVEADLATRRFSVGARVETVGLLDEDSDSGRVVRYLTAATVLVAWDGGVTTPCAVKSLVEAVETEETES